LPSTAKRVGGPTMRRDNSVRCTLSAPGPARKASPWAGCDRGESNEITAIPQLLQQIDLTDSLITIDAMGCQKEISREIVDGGGDFVISVKDNQPKLREAIEAYFEKTSRARPGRSQVSVP